MDFLREWLPWLPSIEEIIRWGGVIGIVAIVFAETGLLIGFFLPGDSLLVTAGIFAAMGDLSLAALLCLVSLAAIVGDAVGYRDPGVVAPPAVERHRIQVPRSAGVFTVLLVDAAKLKQDFVCRTGN